MTDEDYIKGVLAKNSSNSYWLEVSTKRIKGLRVMANQNYTLNKIVPGLRDPAHIEYDIVEQDNSSIFLGNPNHNTFALDLYPNTYLMVQI